MAKVYLLYNFFISLIPNKLRYLFHTVAPPSPATIPAKTDQIDLKRVFQMFDKNNDGRITKEELNETLENLGISMGEKDLIKMIEKMDVNGDGCVDIEEFECMYRLIMAEKEEEMEIEIEMREVFDVFDEDGDGFKSVDELKRVMSSLGFKQGQTLESCQMMIMQVDVDGDGRVDYNEFRQMIKCNVSS